GDQATFLATRRIEAMSELAGEKVGLVRRYEWPNQQKQMCWMRFITSRSQRVPSITQMRKMFATERIIL
ncbi:hypothetical protein L0152_27095, partial [bacterium]|nr:hypothetical protein [bacterium]